MFCLRPRKCVSLSGALLAAACAVPTASAGVGRRSILGPVASGTTSAVPIRAANAPNLETTDADRTAGIEWRFHAGSSLYAAPAVDADGTIYAGTGDGYVQAIRSDGSLKWSYTVEGAVAWSPIVDASDHVIVATSAQRLYSILASGSPAWDVRPPAHIATDLSLTPGGFLFGATDGSVWAYSTHSTALWHADLGGTITGGPAIHGTRTVAGTSTGALWMLDGAAKHLWARLGAPTRGAPALLGDGSVIAIAGNALFLLDSGGNVVFRREDVDSFGVVSFGLAVVETGGDLIALAKDGTSTMRVALPARASVAPIETDAGVVCLGTDTGELLFVGPSGKVRRVAIAHAALHRPVWDAVRRRVIVAAGDGTLAAVAVSTSAD